MTLYEDADQRFGALITGLVPGIDMPDEAVVPTPRAAYLPAQLTLSACPVYPKEPLTSPPELMRLSREVRVGDYYGTADFFPLPDTGHRLVGDGIALHFPGKPNLRTYHTQLNVYGLYLYRQSLLHLSDEDERDGEAPTVRFSEILARSDQFLESANRFFRELSYFGPLEIRLQLEHALQQGLRPVSYEFGHLRPGNPRFSTENAISLTRRISDQEIVDQRDALLLHFAERVAWMFGCEITEAELQRVYGDLGRRAAPV